MLKIGLTGGIGCGKTRVANLFAEQGVPVLDSDLIARELVEPGTAALAEIVRVFGDGVLLAGCLNRALLRTLVFQDAERKRQLEAILHPAIYRELRIRIERLQAPYCILAIPLLLETGQRAFVDRVLVVDSAPELQMARVMRRDHLDEASVRQIMVTQASRADRLAAADDVVDNNDGLEALRLQVGRLHRRYVALASQTPL
jgi:dephospho-CoA kinase